MQNLYNLHDWIEFLRQDCGDHHDHYQEDERRTYLGLKRQHYGDHHDMIIMINPL